MIRTARNNDLNVINSFLLNMKMLPYDEKTIFFENRFVKVLEINNCVIGLFSFLISLDEAELEVIYVVPEERKKGFASIMLEEMIKMCKKEHCSKIFLEVRESNKSALTLYEKYGFEYVSKRNKYYGDENALVMCKELG